MGFFIMEQLTIHINMNKLLELDINKFQDTPFVVSELSRDELIQKAKDSEKDKRYYDMVYAMSHVAKIETELNNEERRLLSVAYKNVADARRAAYNVTCIIKREAVESQQERIKEYLDKVEVEIEEICYDLFALLEQYLIPKASNVESKVYYLKMHGDYYKYLTSIANFRAIVKGTEEAYQEAFDLSQALTATNPIKLGVALTFSTFCYETLNCPERGLAIATEAFEAAMAELDTMDAETYKDSTLTIKLLHQKIRLWKIIRFL